MYIVRTREICRKFVTYIHLIIVIFEENFPLKAEKQMNILNFVQDISPSMQGLVKNYENET